MLPTRNDLIPPQTTPRHALKAGAIVCALMLSLLCPALLFVEPTPWTLAAFAGGLLGFLAGLVLVERPLICACCAIVFVYFPRGIVWGFAYSLFYDFAVTFATIGFLLKAISQRDRIAWTGATALMGGFLIWCIGTLMWAPDLISARQQLIEYTLVIVLLFLFHNLIDSREKLDNFLTAVAAGGWILLIAGLGTILLYGYQPGMRLRIADVNENLVPTMLLVAFAGVAWGANAPRVLRRGSAALLSFAYLAGAALLALTSGSRGAVISLAVTLALMIVARSTRRWSVFGLCLALLAGLAAPFIFATVSERFATEEGGEFGGRKALWESGILLLNDTPFGVGLGNGKPSIPHYLYGLISSEEIGLFSYRSTHNPVLDVGIDTGILGMLLYSSAIVAAWMSFGRAWVRRREVGLPNAYFAIVFCIAIGYFISWIRDGGMNTHLTLFIILAMLIAPARLRSRQKLTTAASVAPELHSS